MTSVLDFDASDNIDKQEENDNIEVDSKGNFQAENEKCIELNKVHVQLDLVQENGCDNRSLDNVNNTVDIDSPKNSIDINSNEENDVKCSVDEGKVETREYSTLEKTATLKRRSVYDSAGDDVSAGISELEQSVCQLISNVGNSIGNGLIDEETEEDIKKESSGGSGRVSACSVTRVECSATPVDSGVDPAAEGLTADSPRRTVQVLSPVVEMICDTLPDLAPTLSRLVLAIDLDADQVSNSNYHLSCEHS